MDPAEPTLQPTNSMQKEPRRHEQKSSVRTKNSQAHEHQTTQAKNTWRQQRRGGGGDGAHLDAGVAPLLPDEDAVAMPPWYSSTAGC